MTVYLCNFVIMIILFSHAVQVKSNTCISVNENIKGICNLCLHLLKVSYISTISKDLKNTHINSQLIHCEYSILGYCHFIFSTHQHQINLTVCRKPPRNAWLIYLLQSLCSAGFSISTRS